MTDLQDKWCGMHWTQVFPSSIRKAYCSCCYCHANVALLVDELIPYLRQAFTLSKVNTAAQAKFNLPACWPATKSAFFPLQVYLQCFNSAIVKFSGLISLNSPIATFVSLLLYTRRYMGTDTAPDRIFYLSV